ncbi:type II secretion system protein [Yoonia sediminilitoris]|uniref:General secretion pathway protein G n=1 Tax=Yoonia sediminilitoris TaxID=1286148 RepID=A0A2T6KLG0_9RHOB|nr:type II secretion system protein [Yoonia sediminilitoris]PUB17049.1 general secretion pathway protein G [Yoonia sediminilitoris]RCW97344.1 general secretion pathway protein G [Yoonia sediminilitoris]
MRCSRSKDRGATLAELLVVLVIIGVLAVVTVPIAETAVQREKEMALRETLRDVRTALDAFNADFRAEEISEAAASENGWPPTLEVLITGVEGTDGRTRRYLRSLPRNPFARQNRGLEEQWRVLGYTDPPDAEIWNGVDIYDIRPRTDKTALDGTQIADW